VRAAGRGDVRAGVVVRFDRRGGIAHDGSRLGPGGNRPDGLRRVRAVERPPARRASLATDALARGAGSGARRGGHAPRAVRRRRRTGRDRPTGAAVLSLHDRPGGRGRLAAGARLPRHGAAVGRPGSGPRGGARASRRRVGDNAFALAWGACVRAPRRRIAHLRSGGAAGSGGPADRPDRPLRQLRRGLRPRSGSS